MASSESEQHLSLKRGAALWAQAHGYRVVAPEVALPNSRYRADVAAYRPDRKSSGNLAIGQTAVFECKQARSDFLKDARTAKDTIDRLERLAERRQTLEKLLGVHFPNLRRGESLFPEFDNYNFEQLDHKGYREVMRETRILQKRLYEKTKFERLMNWRCANAFYLVVTPEIIAEHEAPEGWGLLVQGEENTAEESDTPEPRLHLVRRPAFVQCNDATRLELLQRIAAFGTKEMNRHLGVEYDEVWEAARSTV